MDPRGRLEQRVAEARRDRRVSGVAGAILLVLVTVVLFVLQTTDDRTLGALAGALVFVYALDQYRQRQRIGDLEALVAAMDA